MLKLIGAVLIILASVGIGYSKSRELTLRERNLEEFFRILVYLKGEIRCGNSSLPDALRDTAQRCQGVYDTFLNDVVGYMETNTEENLGVIFRRCAQKNLSKTVLGKEERRKISMLGECLGYLDREMQLRQLELYEQDFQYFLQKLQKDKVQQQKIYRSLGAMGGIMLAVLFW